MKSKKTRRKHGGFTLVECVVAMAILCIMSLLLMMIMSVTVQQRNKNMQLERDIDTQVVELANNAPSDPTATPSTEPVVNNIVFSDSGTWTEAIPADGVAGVVAKKKVYPNDNVALGALNYDFSAYNVVTAPSSGTAATSGATPDPDSEIYGGCELDGTPTINKNDSQKQITISFKCKNHAQDKSMKYTLPEGVELDEITTKSNAKVSIISSNVIRIEPVGAVGSNVNVEVIIKFK